LVCHIKRGTKAGGIWEKGTEEIFGPKKEKVTGDCRKQHSEDLCGNGIMYTLSKARKMKWAGHVARMAEKRKI
jgi:hypothetical protein